MPPIVHVLLINEREKRLEGEIWSPDFSFILRLGGTMDKFPTLCKLYACAHASNICGRNPPCSSLFTLRKHYTQGDSEVSLLSIVPPSCWRYTMLQQCNVVVHLRTFANCCRNAWSESNIGIQELSYFRVNSLFVHLGIPPTWRRRPVLS